MVYYTRVLSHDAGPAQQNVYYAVGAGAAVSIFALIVYLRYHWLFFAWTAMAAGHLTHFFWLAPASANLAAPPAERFWIAFGSLTPISLRLLSL